MLAAGQGPDSGAIAAAHAAEHSAGATAQSPAPQHAVFNPARWPAMSPDCKAQGFGDTQHAATSTPATSGASATFGSVAQPLKAAHDE
jgi:hypothetical protein